MHNIPRVVNNLICTLYTWTHSLRYLLYINYITYQWTIADMCFIGISYNQYKQRIIMPWTTIQFFKTFYDAFEFSGKNYHNLINFIYLSFFTLRITTQFPLLINNRLGIMSVREFRSFFFFFNNLLPRYFIWMESKDII